MNKLGVSLAAGIALAVASLGAQALGTNEKGCLVGGAAGGLAGHAIGGHTGLGAALGCGAGILVNKDRVKKKDAEASAKKRQEVAARKAREKRQVARQDTQPLR